jgi:hypothetical protein
LRAPVVEETTFEPPEQRRNGRFAQAFGYTQSDIWLAARRAGEARERRLRMIISFVLASTVT